MIIIEEAKNHYLGVRQLHEAAFPSAVEADLVEQIRKDGDAAVSLVACEDDTVVGHVMFSEMKTPFKAIGMAPVAVLESKREQGIAAF